MGRDLVRMKVSMVLNGSRLALRSWNPETLASSCANHAWTEHHGPRSQTRISRLSCTRNSLLRWAAIASHHLCIGQCGEGETSAALQERLLQEWASSLPGIQQ